MTLIIDMVTGEVLEETRSPERNGPERAEDRTNRPERYAPRPDLVPVTPEPSKPVPPPFLGKY